MMFGTGATIYAAPGITSLASKAAQVGPTQFVTSDAAGYLATANFSPQDIAASLGAQIGTLSSRIETVGTEARRGIAATAAIAQAPTPSAPGHTTFALNGSLYRGEGGVGFAFQHRLSGTSIPVYVSGSFGSGGGTGACSAASAWRSSGRRPGGRAIEHRTFSISHAPGTGDNEPARPAAAPAAP